MKKPTPTKPRRPHVLDDVTLAHVTGGDTRDAASGLPTGQRMHKPLLVEEPS